VTDSHTASSRLQAHATTVAFDLHGEIRGRTHEHLSYRHNPARCAFFHTRTSVCAPVCHVYSCTYMYL
jgi:hypothetical protein